MHRLLTSIALLIASVASAQQTKLNLGTQVQGTLPSANGGSTHIVATSFAGADIGAKVNAAIAACNSRLLSHIVTGCTVEIPATPDFSAWPQTTTITPPPNTTSFQLLFTPGACLTNATANWSIDMENFGNSEGTLIENPCIVLTGSTNNGIRLGSGFGMHIRNPNIIGTYRYSSGDVVAGDLIRLDGSDTNSIEGGLLANGWNQIHFAISPSTGYPPNANRIEGTHLTGAANHPIYGEHVGAGNRLTDLTFDPPAYGAQETCGYISGANALSIVGNYCEGQVGAGSVSAVASVTAGSTTVVVSGTLPPGVAVGQPISGASVDPGSTITAISGTTLTISRPGILNATNPQAAIQLWPNPLHYGFVLSGSVETYVAGSYFGLTNAHATFLLDGASATFVSNSRGGSEPAFLDLTANGGGATLIANNDGSVGLNPAGVAIAKITQGENFEQPHYGVSETDPAVMSLSQNGQGWRVNGLQGNAVNGVPVACSIFNNGGTTPLMTFGSPNGTHSMVDCNGTFYAADGVGQVTPGFSGTCPSGHSLVVQGGIVTGCN